MVVGLAAPPRLKLASRHSSDEVPGALVGSVLGDYRLVEYLGRGGMADVYAALGTAPDGTKTRFAVKRFMRKLAGDQRLLRLFFHEAHLATTLSHENLVRGVDFGVEDGAPFLVMELVEGVPCDAVQRWSASQKLPIALAISIVRRVLRALDYVHHACDPRGRPLGIVHHDVSPDNILLGRRGEVKLSDFGVATSAHAADVTSMRLRGKLGYMAPEQVAGLATDARSDLFSAGVLLAELLLGRRLFQRNSELEVLTAAYDCDLTEALDELPPEPRRALEDVLQRALARDPTERFPSARAFSDALTASADRLGARADAGDLALWLLERGLVGTASGVRRVDAEPALVRGDVAQKISAARLEVMTAAEEPERPRLRSVPAGNERLRISSGDGRRHPDLSVSELLERIATGRAARGLEVSSGGKPAIPIHAHPLFSFTGRAAALRFDDGSENRAEWSVPLDRSRLPSILFSLASARATGLLTLRAGARHKRVYYSSGLPIFIASSEPRELFGRVAVARGLLDESRLDSVAAWAARQGRRLGDAMVTLGLAPAGLVLRALVAQFEERFTEIGSWVEGTVAFTRGVRPGITAPRPIGSAHAFPYWVVRSGFADLEISAYLEGVRGAPLVATGLRAPVPADAEELEVLSALPAHAELGELEQHLATAGVAPPAATRRAVFVGLAAGQLASPGYVRV
jgi:tRNA A-37 threonylcarbamoyl transferase component Bud32